MQAAKGVLPLHGRFGQLTEEQTAYLRAIGRAYALAPEGRWAEGRLGAVLDEECNRYGVGTDAVVPQVPPIVDAASTPCDFFYDSCRRGERL